MQLKQIQDWFCLWPQKIKLGLASLLQMCLVGVNTFSSVRLSWFVHHLESFDLGRPFPDDLLLCWSSRVKDVSELNALTFHVNFRLVRALAFGLR
jgi:hypothetical protein